MKKRHPIDECRQRLQVLVAELDNLKEHFSGKHPLSAEESAETLHALQATFEVLTTEINGRIFERYNKHVAFDVPEQLVESIQAGAWRACNYWLSEEPHIDVSVLSRPRIRKGIERLFERAITGKRGFHYEIRQAQAFWDFDDSTIDTVVQLALFEEVRYG